MIRRLFFFLNICIFSSLSAISISAQAGGTITLTSPTLQIGESVIIEAHIHCDSQCSLFSTTLTFNPAIIEVEAVEIGDYLGQLMPVENIIDNVGGTIRLAAITMGTAQPPPPESDILFTIHVHALAAGITQFISADVQLGDSNANPLDATLRGGLVRVQAPLTSTLMPTATYTSEPTTMVLAGFPPGELIFPGHPKKLYSINPTAPNNRGVSPIDIWVQCLDCGDDSTVRITLGDGIYDFPVWSPDGSMVAALFHNQNQSDCLNDIVILSAQGSWIRTLNGAVAFCREIAWINNETEIAYSDEQGNLNVINLLSLQRRVIVPADAIQNRVDNVDVNGLVWEPEQKRLAFWTALGTDRNDESGWTIWIVNGDGSNLVQVSNPRNGFGFMDPQWIPNGDLAVTSVDSARNEIELWKISGRDYHVSRVASPVKVISPWYFDHLLICRIDFYCSASPWEPD